MRVNKRILSLLMVATMLLSSIAVFGQGIYDDIKWVSEPKIIDFDSKKIDVYGALEIPESYKGNTKIKLEINGSPVSLDKDGSFTKSIFKASEIEIKVFTGKDEIVELGRILNYVVDKTHVNEVISLIEQLPDVNMLTLEDKDMVAGVREKYDALLPEEKELVTNYDKLVAVEYRLVELHELLLQEMIQAAEREIESLPSFEDIRIEHKEAVLEAMEKVERVKEIDKNAVVKGERLLAQMLEKIEYLKKEAADNYFFPSIYMHSPESLVTFAHSEILFEGYVTNIKYLDRILVNKQEANVEYVDYVEVISNGSIVHKGSAYKFSKTLVLEDKAHAISVNVISQSGKSGSIARRFYVDTTAPELNIVVKERDVTSATAELEINMKDMFGYLRLYEFDSNIYTYDRNYSYPVNQTITQTVSLAIGENVFPYTLVDGAGNKTEKQVSIVREEPKPTLYATYYHNKVSPFVTNTMLIVNVENIEDAVYFRARYINAQGQKVSTNTVKLGEEVQIGSGQIDPTNIEIVIMDGTIRKNTIYIFENVNPIKIEK